MKTSLALSVASLIVAAISIMIASGSRTQARAAIRSIQDELESERKAVAILKKNQEQILEDYMSKHFRMKIEMEKLVAETAKYRQNQESDLKWRLLDIGDQVSKSFRDIDDVTSRADEAERRLREVELDLGR